MRFEFSKMQGIGNDFVVIDAINQSVNLTAAEAKLLADRRYGVGCDQILLVEKPTSAEFDFRYRILNADGSEVGQCGNGARCFARFVQEQGLSDSREISVQTKSGTLILQLMDDEQVRVDMGVPVFEPSRIPFVANERALTYSLDVADSTIEISALSMGNPHAVTIVDDVNTAAVPSLGPLIESHPRFPERVNAGFMQIENSGHIQLRVHERGAGETLACGSGACAAVVAGRQQNLLDAKVMVDLPGGALIIEWYGEGQSVFMTGPAQTVYQGSINL